MPAPNITTLPTAPSRSQSPETFSTDADAFLGALPDFGTEANAQADYLDALAVTVDADATAAVAAAAIATSVANYRGDYNPATTYQIGDGVSYSGRRYAAKTVNTGVTPADGANWLLINDGDVLGPVTANDGGIAFFDGATGKIIKSGLSTGTAGQTLISGGSGILPSWQSVSGTISETFTASGAITAGKPVVLAGSNVQEIAGTNTTRTSSSITIGAPFTPDMMGFSDDQTKVVAVRMATSAYQIAVGTLNVGETAYTWGAAISLPVNGSTSLKIAGKLSFEPGSNTRFAIVGVDNSLGTEWVGTIWIGDISGDTATVTRNVIFTSATTTPVANGYCYDVDKYVLVYNQSNVIYGISAIGTGQTISSAGGATSLKTTANSARGLSIDYNVFDKTKHVIGYVNSSNNDAYLFVVSIVPNTFTVGTEINQRAGTMAGCWGLFDRIVPNRVWAWTWDVGTSSPNYYGYISGFSGTTTLTSASLRSTQSVPQPNLDDYVDNLTVGQYTYGHDFPVRTAFAITIRSNSTSTGLDNYYARCLFATDDTSTPSLGSIEAIITTSSSFGPKTAQYNPPAMGRYFYYNYDNTVIWRMPLTDIRTNLSDANFIGIASQSVSNGQSVSIDLLGGYNRNQAGLTPFTIYYVNITGAYETTSTAQNIKIGKALKSTSIQIKAPTI
jgi:hypothetical protein